MQLAELGGAGLSKSFAAVRVPSLIEPFECVGGVVGGVGRSGFGGSLLLRHSAGLRHADLVWTSASHPVFSGWQALGAALDPEE